MKVQINGEKREFPEEEMTVQQLLDELALGYPVLVERNGEALFPREFEELKLQDGDSLELLRMVAGG